MSDLLSLSLTDVCCVFFRQGVDMMCLSASVSHFLNAYLSSCQQAHPPLPADELNPKNSKREFKLGSAVTASLRSSSARP